MKNNWTLTSQSYQIADTGDYDGHYEISNGLITLGTTSDDEDSLNSLIYFLNALEIQIYSTPNYEIELLIEKEENKRLNLMIQNNCKTWDEYLSTLTPENDLPF